MAAAFFYIRPDLADTQIPRFQENLEHFFQSFQPDGVCREGMGYWNYGFGFFVSLRQHAEGIHWRKNGFVSG